MDLATQSPTAPKADPATPHPKSTQVLDAEPTPPTPSKPKTKETKETKLALNDETADFAVICEGQRFMAHKSILETSSPYFARMFRFNGSVSLLITSTSKPY
jgi:hypothetical protein